MGGWCCRLSTRVDSLSCDGIGTGMYRVACCRGVCLLDHAVGDARCRAVAARVLVMIRLGMGLFTGRDNAAA